jgi:lipopolysaccharide transport system ATP-binding protein
MSESMIQVEGLGKRYRIRHQQAARYSSLRDVISNRLRFPFLRRGRFAEQPAAIENFWALRDVTFDVNRGEVVGIIGRNGAGKSTLLKVLSRITEPTCGRVVLNGRVASLLEVGTGFHPELTGRENIYLNGAILGMARREISRKFDEIVDFAEVERFLDTPVKYFSSGMYVRLAFAVAAHLEPDILVVDEVLAVGDAQFQKKCLGKMQDVTRSDGRTILFVSHNMSIVRSLCGRGVVLEQGCVSFVGNVEDALIHYSRPPLRSKTARRERSASVPSIVRVDVDEGQASLGNLMIEVEFLSPWPLAVQVGAVIYNRMGSPVFGINNSQRGAEPNVRANQGVATLRVSDVAIHSGIYSVAIFLGDKDRNYDVLENAAAFTFVSPEPLPLTLSADFIGPMRVSGSWTIDVLQ